MQLPKEIIKSWNLTDGNYPLTEQLYGELTSELIVNNGKGLIKVNLDPLASLILKMVN